MTEYEMSTFQTDTAKLWYAGTSVLPSLADKYAGISYTVWVTRGGSDDAFAGGDSPSGKLPGVYGEWERLRASFQDILSQTSANLIGTGRAMCAWAEDLSVTDGEGAAEIAAAEKEIEPVEVSPRKSSTDEEPPTDGPRGPHQGPR